MTQASLDFSRPPPPASAPIRDAIKAEVRSIVLARKGSASAITGAELAAEVGRRLDLDGWLSAKTLLRRCQEGVAALVAAGEPIASTSASGYFVAEAVEEIEAGRRDLGHRLGSLARRYRAFDRATADRILELLGQQPLDVEAGR